MLPVRCPPGVRVLVLYPLVVLSLGALGGLRSVPLTLLLLGTFGYLCVVRSTPLSVLPFSVYSAPIVLFASLVLPLDGSGLLGSLLTSCCCLMLRSRGRDGGEVPVLVGTGSSSRAGRRSPVDVVARRLPSSLRWAGDLGRRCCWGGGWP